MPRPMHRIKKKKVEKPDIEFLAYSRESGFTTVEAADIELAEEFNPHLMILDDVNDIDVIVMNKIYTLI